MVLTSLVKTESGSKGIIFYFLLSLLWAIFTTPDWTREPWNIPAADDRIYETFRMFSQRFTSSLFAVHIRVCRQVCVSHDVWNAAQGGKPDRSKQVVPINRNFHSQKRNKIHRSCCWLPNESGMSRNKKHFSRTNSPSGSDVNGIIFPQSRPYKTMSVNLMFFFPI